MAAVPHCGHARNGGAWHKAGFRLYWKIDLQDQEARRETTDVEGGSGIDFPDGR